jgi:hypothetical protein
MARKDPQLGLPLTERPRWGGRRAGAGRKRAPGRPQCLPHESREHFSRPVPGHVTLRLLPGLLSLRTVRLVRELEGTFARGCERSDFRLVHYSLQGNHAHLIVEARDRDALGRGMKSIGARLARAVNRIADRSGAVLADRYHFRPLRTPREVRHALRYVLLGPPHRSRPALRTPIHPRRRRREAPGGSSRYAVALRALRSRRLGGPARTRSVRRSL